MSLIETISEGLGYIPKGEVIIDHVSPPPTVSANKPFVFVLDLETICNQD